MIQSNYMETVLITGGTGMIGKALCEALLKKNYQVIVLTRNPEDHKSENILLEFAGWDPQKSQISKDAISRADHIIHLAGEGVADKRWTNKRKKEIESSRIDTAALIYNTLKATPNKIKTLITAAGIGWYGPDPSIPNPSPFREDASAYNDFLGNTCRMWEASVDPFAALGKRVVKIRTGLVLSKEGGMLEEFRKPIRFGLATILSGGKQIMSWIHIDDLIRIYILAIENSKMTGPYNAVAPKPVSNKELVLTLARIKKGNFYIPVYVPAFVLKLVLGELSIEVLKSTTVSCDKLHTEGFVFIFPSIEPALVETERK